MFCRMADIVVGGSTDEPMLCHSRSWWRTMPSTNPPIPMPSVIPAAADMPGPAGGSSRGGRKNRHYRSWYHRTRYRDRHPNPREGGAAQSTVQGVRVVE